MVSNLYFSVSSLFIYLLLSFSCHVLAEDSYDAYKVVRTNIQDPILLQAISYLGLDVWNCGGVLKMGDNDLMLQDMDIISLYWNDVSFEHLIENVQREKEREWTELGLLPRFGEESEDDWFKMYRNYTEIVQYAQGIAEDNPSIASYSSIGTTYENRDIPVLEITGTGTGEKKKVLVIGGMHAREWLAPVVVTYLAQELATLYDADDSITSLLDSCDIHFIPVANPDGYEYSWTTSRTWRKNRSPNSDGSFGVDLNKNFDVDDWNTACQYSIPNSNTYCGTAPFSEQETKSIKNYVDDNGPFDGSVEYGSYGQKVLRPYSASSEPPPNDSELQAIANTWASTMSDVNGIEYNSLPATVVYNVSGSSLGYLFSVAGIQYSFMVELGDTGSYGYFLPVSKILPTCVENYEGFITFLQAVCN